MGRTLLLKILVLEPITYLYPSLLCNLIKLFLQLFLNHTSSHSSHTDLYDSSSHTLYRSFTKKKSTCIYIIRKHIQI